MGLEIENLILPDDQELSLDQLLIIRHSLAMTLAQLDKKIEELQACLESDSSNLPS